MLTLRPKVKPLSSANTVIQRIPYPEVTDLPAELQGFARNMKGMVDSSIYNDLLRDLAINHYSQLYATDQAGFIAELEEEKLGSSARKRKTIYGGALQSSSLSGGAGVFNPDKIPVKTYERMQRDAQLSLGLALIKKPIEHVNFSVECSSDAVKSVVDWTLQKIYVRLIRDLLTGIDFGRAYLEKTWKRIKRLVLKKQVTSGDGLKEEVVFDGEFLLLWPYSMHPSTYKVLLDKHGELTGIKQSKTSGGSVKIKRSKLITFVQDMQFGNWYGISRLKNAYTWWYWGEVIFQFMIRYLERKASPPLIIKAPLGYSVDSSGAQVNNFVLGLRIGNSMVSNAVGVLPNVFDSNGKSLWDMQYLMDDQRVFMFIEVLNFINIMKTRSLLVPDNVAIQQGQEGSFASADAHSDIHFVLEESLLREFEQILNSQVVPYIVKYNFAPELRVACKVKIEKLTLTRKLLLKEVFNKMLGVINQFARDGAKPTLVPDIASIADILEIPVTPIKNVFDLSGWDAGKPPNDDNDGKDDIAQEEDEDENNKGKKRTPRTRQQKRKRVA